MEWKEKRVTVYRLEIFSKKVYYRCIKKTLAIGLALELALR